jgi:hypothetical protein
LSGMYAYALACLFMIIEYVPALQVRSDKREMSK